ncbi:Zip-domain-containing protein [Panus rudis PR-1116 ss-1]|nr:Zip-domain-containing protein [Panus rudis PR-1116 ss-1]
MGRVMDANECQRFPISAEELWTQCVQLTNDPLNCITASLLTAIIFHQLFEGFSLGIRIASLPVAPFDASFVRKLFKPILAFTFAVTTPLGIAIGLGLFSQGRTNGAYLRLVQGLMSALSAGMLIYAACVEMLAGDFMMDPLLWRSSVRRQVLALGSVFDQY